MSDIANTEVLDSLKRATVAIGTVVKNGIDIQTVLGTGFFVKPGYIMTAEHVIDGCEKVIESFRREGIPSEIGVFFPTWTESELKLNVLHSARDYGIKTFTESYPGSPDLDVGLIIPREQGEYEETTKIRYLEIRKKPSKLNLYSKVCMCGFPGGAESLRLSSQFGMRFSPTTQFGYLTSLMPFDEIPRPYGIQTDIMGTGGSSGSAIVDLKDGDVIGIAQTVFGGEVKGTTLAQKIGDGILTLNRIPVSGMAKVGLVYGVSFNIFTDFPEMAKESYDKNIAIATHPLEVSGLRFGYITPSTTPRSST
jgi:hypothetical protein